MRVVGRTPMGRKVMHGNDCFKAVDTHGIPVEVMTQVLWERNAVPDWRGFVVSALDHGWSMETIERRCRREF